MNFSVLMSVYAKECPGYLREALQSLADQTLKADEFVLVEDGSLGSDLKAVIDEYRDVLNIKSIPLATNQGLASALNEGIKHCSYDLVARMDSDDIALPHRFQKQITFMAQHPEVSASSALIEEFDATGRTISVRRLPLDHEELLRFAKRRSPLSHPVAIFRKRAVEAVGGYPLIFPEDYALWALMLRRGYKMANMPDVLLRMRTDQAFIARRGPAFLKGEVALLHYQRQIGFLGWRDYAINLIIRAAVRLPPAPVKRLLYKLARR
ncbi:glycosyltransferase [Alkalispirochaeta alkalica]|uniref:glycosyltransferase n=1 Tax=Alkalispirochaeta alkalica TaxID=46356 RepID=UPI00037DDBBB|nr:glycosyltransferase [Alkalispirochaeta alkalica]